MKKLFQSQSLSVGLAMFSMFFGAGNIIFPLALGQYAGDKNFFAILGLILTAAVMPILGVIAMILFEGNYRNFFGRLGKIPGFLLALTTISLLGPLGSTPRCIALSYTTLKHTFLDISPALFSLIACLIIFLFTIRKRQILTLLGWGLTPLLLISLITIICLGIFQKPEITPVAQTKAHLFVHGLKEGYNTMDLLAAFFFSSTIINILRIRLSETAADKQAHLRIAMRASLIGAFLLAAIYMGFSYLAAFHAPGLDSTKDELLALITMKIAGPIAGPLVAITIALACLTTAIALISAFTDFLQKEVFQEKVSYSLLLILSLTLTFCVSSFQFTGISAFLGPILQIVYPGLIVLTFLNIAYHVKKFTPIKLPVFSVFLVSLGIYLFNLIN